MIDAATSILIVDDNAVDREALRRLLRGQARLTETASAAEAIAALEFAAGTTPFDCVLLDNRLPDRDGIDLLDAFIERDVPVLMLTGQGSESIAVEAMKRGAGDYLGKAGLNRDGLIKSIEHVMERAMMARTLRQQQAQLAQTVEALREQTEALEQTNRELKAREAELQVAQKMDALGRLAGGIAHDFNNILTAIVNYATFARDSAVADSTMARDLGEVLDAADRAKALVHKLLTFSRDRPAQSAAIDVPAVAAAMAPFLGRLVSDTIRVEFEADPGRGFAMTDRVGLEQVLMNLVVNARDAMPKGGAIRIRTREVMVDLSEPSAPQTGRNGPHVQIEVRDEGEGISPAHIDRIFEPFFSTKPRGQGTGLGLATCYSLVKQWGGTITVASDVGVGTTFSIWLPCCDPAPEPATVTLAAAPATALAAPDTALVLLVDDSAALRKIVARGLQRLGFRVHEAGSVGEALGVLDSASGNFSAVVSDVELPDDNGISLVRQARERVDGLAAVLISGHAPEDLRERYGAIEGVVMLQKPFLPVDLAAHLRQSIAAGLAASSGGA